MANMASIHFFSLNPLPLDQISRPDSPKVSPEARLSQRMEQLWTFDPQGDLSSQLRARASASTILNEIQRSQSPALNDAVTSEGAPPTRRQRSLSVTAAAAASHSFTSIIHGMCNVPTFLWASTCLKDISAFVQQIDVRNEQARRLPLQYRTVNRLVQHDLPSASAHYINFYNCIWLILNDIIVGYTFGIFLRENHEALGVMLQTSADLFVSQFVRGGLIWLENWPIGLKLNTELSHFFSISYLAILDALVVVTRHSPSFSTVVFLVGCSGPLGLTMTLSLISDILSAVTVPFYLSYLCATAIFRVLLSAAASLWRLFRGKRKNTLQDRTDAWDYEMDQLLLGTILFTLIAFLFPTVAAYYLFFAAIRLSVIMVHASLETVLAFMNHFPLFAIMLRVKNPSRLPGGVYIVIEGTPPQPVIKNAPIPLGRIFFQHVRLWSNLTAHYSPIRLVRCLLVGEFINPIERYSIRYDQL